MHFLHLVHAKYAQGHWFVNIFFVQLPSNHEVVKKKRKNLKNLLLQNKIPPRKKEGTFTWILQEPMQIMRHGWLTRVHPFI
jgi:hypothetical protein